MIIVEIRKFIAPLITLDIGKISLGKYTFFTILSFIITLSVPAVTVVVKKCPWY